MQAEFVAPLPYYHLNNSPSVPISAAKTPHAWMIEALEAQARLTETRLPFVNDALTSAAEVDAGGVLYAMQDVHEYIIKKAAGKPAKHPKPSSIAKSKPRTTITKNRSC